MGDIASRALMNAAGILRAPHCEPVLISHEARKVPIPSVAVRVLVFISSSLSAVEVVDLVHPVTPSADPALTDVVSIETQELYVAARTVLLGIELCAAKGLDASEIAAIGVIHGCHISSSLRWYLGEAPLCRWG